MVRELSGESLPSLHIVDMIAIGRDGRPRTEDVEGPASFGKGYLQHLGKDVVALVIDEAQDVHRNHTKPWVFGRRPEVVTHLTVAIDFNQNIFADNRATALLTALKRAKIVCLNYSYRIPREAGLVAQKLISHIVEKDEDAIVTQVREIARSMSFGFSSEFVKVRVYDNVEQGIAEAAQEHKQLIASGPCTIGIVFCGNSRYRNTYAQQLAGLGFDLMQNKGVLTPRSVKGDEFDYCIVIAPELIENDSMRQDFALQSIYVALSRCRRGVTVYTDQTFAELLTHPAVEVRRI